MPHGSAPLQAAYAAPLMHDSALITRLAGRVRAEERNTDEAGAFQVEFARLRAALHDGSFPGSARSVSVAATDRGATNQPVAVRSGDRVRDRLGRCGERVMAATCLAEVLGHARRPHVPVQPPPLSAVEVVALETWLGIRLPSEYRSYVIEVANGGIGPRGS